MASCRRRSTRIRRGGRARSSQRRRSRQLSRTSASRSIGESSRAAISHRRSVRRDRRASVAIVPTNRPPAGASSRRDVVQREAPKGDDGEDRAPPRRSPFTRRSPRPPNERAPISRDSGKSIGAAPNFSSSSGRSRATRRPIRSRLSAQHAISCNPLKPCLCRVRSHPGWVETGASQGIGRYGS